MIKLLHIGIALVAEAAEHGAEHAEHAGGEAGAPHLPNFITFLYKWMHDNVIIEFLHHWENVIFALITGAFISILAIVSTRKKAMIPSGLQNFMEAVVEGLANFFQGILGKDAKQFTPFLGTLFIYIWCMNMLGMVPFFMSPTGGLAGGFNITLSLAVCVFLYVQWVGVRRLGFGGYIHHMMGSPKNGIQWALVPLNLPIHIIGELAKPLSLSLRLLGNITGEDMLLAAFAVLGITALSFLEAPIGLPLHAPLFFLALLTGTIQALVFTLLSTIYFSMMLPHEEH